MSTTGSAVRPTSSDTLLARGSWSLLVVAVLVLALLGTPFYDRDETRAVLSAAIVPSNAATLAAALLGAALAWRSLARRSYVWAEPAALTWSDFVEPRSRSLHRRLLVGWVVRFGLVGYVVAVAGFALGGERLPDAVAVVLGVAALAAATARRRPGRVLGVADGAGPVVLAVAGVMTVSVELPAVVGWVVAAVTALGALVLAHGPSLASVLTRQELVAASSGRTTRRTLLVFFDVWALLPTGEPVRWPRLFATGSVLTRYLAAATWARRSSSMMFAILAALAVAVTATAPTAPVEVVAAAGSYLAVLPFSAPLANLHHRPSLARWIDRPDRAARLAALVGFAVLEAAWLALACLLGLPWSPVLVLIGVLVAVAIARTVTRALVDFDNLGVVAVEGVLVPMGLVLQVLRGPDLLVVGLVLLSVLPTVAAVLALLALGAAGFLF